MNNDRTVEWFFDFISPFSYLQLECFDRLPRDTVVAFRPILFAGLLDHWGHKGPAEIPEKRRFTYRHVQWMADRDGIPMRFPPAHPFNPLPALRLSIAAGCTQDAVRRIFRYLWRDGGSLGDAAAFAALGRAVGVTDAAAAIQAPAVKDTLRANGDRARALGLFGVPSLLIDGALFWGYDATDMAIAAMCDPGLLGRGELGRVSELPIGVERGRT
jgi:2-hydroxychromene-2-carboxylate isomerase